MLRFTRLLSSSPATRACAALLALSGSFSLAAGKTITVAADGSGDFKTVQEAITAAPEQSVERTRIHIKAGTYYGPMTAPGAKANLTLEGEAAESTVLTWDKNVLDPVPSGQDKFNPGLHVLAPDFRAENLTIQNTAGDRGQALAVRVDADRAVFRKCRLLGWQDTLMINKGRQYFKDCYIEGRVDFIYGDGTAVFDSCTLHSKNGGYITAASTPAEKPFGFVFLHCKLTGDAVPWVDPSGAIPAKAWKLPNTALGRPWRPHASVAFIECEMGEHIKPGGWDNWGKPENEATARFVEFGNTGPGAQPEKRLAWAKHLDKDEAAKITPASVLAGTDAWNPIAEQKP